MMTPSSFLIPGLLLVILIVVGFMVLYPKPQLPPKNNATESTTQDILIQPGFTQAPLVVEYPYTWNNSWWRSNLNGWNNWFGYLTPSTTRWPSFWRPDQLINVR